MDSVILDVPLVIETTQTKMNEILNMCLKTDE